MKLSIFIVFLPLLISCGFRTLEGKVKPVYFSTDPAVFADTLVQVQSVTYQEVKRLDVPCLSMVDLQKGKAVQTFIAQPTIFHKDNNEFLVYPGEHIFITANPSNNYAPTFSTMNQNKVRDDELLVLKTFQKLEKRPKIPLWIHYDFQTVLDAEKAINEKIAPSERASQLLFDSLCAAYRVSSKFKKLTKDYIHNRYDFAVLALYAEYRDTLVAHNIYQNKVRALLPQVNQLTKTSRFTLNVESNTNALYQSMFPNNGIRNMAMDGQFQECFDSIATIFSGPARDYLLSRLMLRALEQGFCIPASYTRQYHHYSMNRSYREIIARAGRAYKKFQHDDPLLPNELLMTDGKTKVRLENVLAQNKGKYVLLDLWASWCMPCIEEIPALQALKKKYRADKIAFINVSVDTNIPAWQTRLDQLRSDSTNNYLLLNKDNAALVRQIRLYAIPRYLLYDKEGNLINIDAPEPSDPQLEKQLDKLLSD